MTNNTHLMKDLCLVMSEFSSEFRSYVITQAEKAKTFLFVFLCEAPWVA